MYQPDEIVRVRYTRKVTAIVIKPPITIGIKATNHSQPLEIWVIEET